MKTTKSGTVYFVHPGQCYSRKMKSEDFRNAALKTVNNTLKRGQPITVVLSCEFCDREELTKLWMSKDESMCDHSESRASAFKKNDGTIDVRGTKEYDFVEVAPWEFMNMMNYTVPDTRTVCSRCYHTRRTSVIEKLAFELRLTNAHSRMTVNEVDGVGLMRRILELANSGRCQAYHRRFYTDCLSLDEARWRSFLSYQRCARCYQSHGATVQTPFCPTCTIQIKTGSQAHIDLPLYQNWVRSALVSLSPCIPTGPIPVLSCTVCRMAESANVPCVQNNRLMNWQLCYGCLFGIMVNYNQDLVLTLHSELVRYIVD
jgi:hypothetical protein